VLLEHYLMRCSAQPDCSPDKAVEHEPVLGASFVTSSTLEEAFFELYRLRKIS
jgi:hypothetical protein